MNQIPITRFDWVSWILFGAGLLLTLHLHLLPALLAALLVYVLVNALVPLLHVSSLSRSGVRALAVILIATVVIALNSLTAIGLTSFVRDSNESVPALVQRMAEIIESSRPHLPDWLQQRMPADTEELRVRLVEWLRAHAGMFQVAGAGLGRALMHIIIGMIIGAMLALESAVPTNMLGPLAVALRQRALCSKVGILPRGICADLHFGQCAAHRYLSCDCSAPDWCASAVHQDHDSGYLCRRFDSLFLATWCPTPLSSWLA
ncbi:MAG: hypothetical protein U1F34_02835 [Gammaproteobacteria bacterium]